MQVSLLEGETIVADVVDDVADVVDDVDVVDNVDRISSDIRLEDF